MGKAAEAFKLRLDAAATPERVAAAASFLSRMLRAAFPNLPDGSITIEVTNYAMNTHVRTQTVDGYQATRKILEFFDNPSKALDSEPAARDIATTLASREQALTNATIYRSKARKPLVTLDDTFTKRMGALAAAARTEPALRGTSVIYSPVLRVGRYDEDKATKARVRIDGECHDVELFDEHNEAEFHSASLQKRVLPVHVNAAWYRGADGRLLYDIRATRLVRVDLSWTPATGAEFVLLVNEAAPSGYCDDDDFEERIARIRHGH